VSLKVYNSELSYLLTLPAKEIIREVIEEALKDLTITNEEQKLLDGIKRDLIDNNKKFFDKMPQNKEELQLLLIEQRNILKKIVNNTYNRAKVDGIISSDELSIYRTLLYKVDEITAKKITIFLNLELDAKEPQILKLHNKIGDTFSNLSATIIMDILAEKLSSQKDGSKSIKEIIHKISSDDVNKEFMIRFSTVLRELSKIPMDHPMDLIAAMDILLNKS
jgi:hypothetical protein